MKRIITIDLRDYDDDMPRFRRPSVRAVIMDGSRIALIHSLRYDYYKFPGGGIEQGEDHISALIREVSEETGLSVIPGTVSELGSVLRVQKSRARDNEIFEQENFYYVCGVADTKGTQSLDEYESEEGFTPEYVEPRYAIEVNRTHDHSDYDSILIERESLVLEYIIKEIL